MDERLEKIKQVVQDVLDASIGVIELKELLDKVVEIGSEKLNAKSCSIFLLVDNKGTLEIVAGSGDIGKKLKESEAKYYIPKRAPFSQKPKEAPQYETWEEEKRLIEDGKPGMRITAWVVKTGEFVRCSGRGEFESHPEHRGKYEKSQGEECQEIIEIPLTFKKDIRYREYRAQADGVIKVENPKDKKNGFDENDEFIMHILAGCVSGTIQKIETEEPKSYKKLFNGAKLLGALLDWFKENEATIQGKNKGVAKEISEFSKDVLRWNIYGIEKMYDKIIEIVRRINGILEFEEDLIKVFEDITKKYEEILGTGVRYREHLIHQFQVFLLGYYIINKNTRFQKTLKDYLQKNGIDGTLDNVMKCWFLSSAFHDIAYSIERINDWLGSYFQTLFSSELVGEKLPFVFLWENLFTGEGYEYHKNILIKLMRERLNIPFESEGAAKLHQIFITTLLTKSGSKKKNHGLFGALIMANQLLKKSYTDSNIPKIILEGAFSVAVHTLDVCEDLYSVQRAKLHDIPFALLLVFCDNAQEWGRPWMKNLTPGAIELEEIKVASDKTTIKLVCNATDLDIEELKRIINGVKANWVTKNLNLIYVKKDTGEEMARI